MAYTPTEWQTGDVVTAEKLNKLEEGVLAASGGKLFVETEYVTDIGEDHDNGFKTIMDANNIFDAYRAGSNVVFHFAGLQESGGYVTEGYINLSGYFPDEEGSNQYQFSASPNWLGNVLIEDEKMFFTIYSD